MTLPDETHASPDDYGRLALASDWLRLHAAGEMDRKLSNSLRELIQSVRKLGKTGTVTLKLTVSQLDDMSVVVTPDIKTSIPQPAERSQHFYVDPEGHLAQRDPYRQVLPFPAHDLTTEE